MPLTYLLRGTAAVVDLHGMRDYNVDVCLGRGPHRQLADPLLTALRDGLRGHGFRITVDLPLEPSTRTPSRPPRRPPSCPPSRSIRHSLRAAPPSNEGRAHFLNALTYSLWGVAVRPSSAHQLRRTARGRGSGDCPPNGVSGLARRQLLAGRLVTDDRDSQGWERDAQGSEEEDVVVDRVGS